MAATPGTLGVVFFNNEENKMLEVVKQENEVTILSNGDAFISQRACAKLCGVEQQAIQQRCLSLKFDVKHGVSPENAFFLVTL